jgi:hypothetical protein
VHWSKMCLFHNLHQNCQQIHQRLQYSDIQSHFSAVKALLSMPNLKFKLRPNSTVPFQLMEKKWTSVHEPCGCKLHCCCKRV